MWFVSVAGQATRNNEYFDQHQLRVNDKLQSVPHTSSIHIQENNKKD